MSAIDPSEKDQLVEMMASGVDLKQLEQWLESRDHRFRSRKSLRRFLLKALRSAHLSQRVEAQSEPLPKIPSLPTYDLNRDGVTFRVCGVAHGQRLFLKMKPEVRQRLRSLVVASSEKVGADYVSERGFARLLDLPKGKELQYGNAMFERMGPRAFLWQVLRLALIVPIFPIAMILLAMSRDPVARESRKCLRDLRHVARAQRLWRLMNLPAQLRMALSPQDFVVVHSEEIAKASIRRVQSEGLSELFILVGLAHQDEIAHFLSVLPFDSISSHPLDR